MMIHSMLVLFPIFCAIVIVLPFVIWKGRKMLSEGREKSWREYQDWKADHFDQSGRCRLHPTYDGTGLPPSDGCDGCAVLHNARPYGDRY